MRNQIVSGAHPASSKGSDARSAHPSPPHTQSHQSPAGRLGLRRITRSKVGTFPREPATQRVAVQGLPTYAASFAPLRGCWPQPVDYQASWFVHTRPMARVQPSTPERPTATARRTTRAAGRIERAGNARTDGAPGKFEDRLANPTRRLSSGSRAFGGEAEVDSLNRDANMYGFRAPNSCRARQCHESRHRVT